jgi:hypothetical protein
MISMHTTDLEDISRKVLVLTGQLGIIFIWLSGMYFHVSQTMKLG